MGSTSRSAALPRTPSHKARKAGDSVTGPPYAAAAAGSSAQGPRSGSDLRLEEEAGDPPRRRAAGVGGEARVGAQRRRPHALAALVLHLDRAERPAIALHVD